MPSLLDKFCTELDYHRGDLHTTTLIPTPSIGSEEWINKGEWLRAAKQAGAKKVFFVDNNPVVVFAEYDSSHSDKISTFNRVWNLARPRLLVLASPGEISVLDLSQRPISIQENQGEEQSSSLKVLETLQNLNAIARDLSLFHRENIESGIVFGDSRFGDLGNRADKALIRDLKVVRRELIEAGLSGTKLKYAHALIGRSIFIRYLEDRRILTETYFQKVADGNSEWTLLLNTDCSNRPGIDFSEHKTIYPRVLSNKAFTYSLFRSLARDFNGDMFPDIQGEESVVKTAHLRLIQDLLYGDVGDQQKLFFKSYRFDLIPLELISSIYEEFYQSAATDSKKKSNARQDGAFYTPSALCEFVLSRILTSHELSKEPRIIDPACGSGIFLVETFRRIVLYKYYKERRMPSFSELKDILKKQIFGIEVNEEAARITAFSLYLSLLHYLDPPSICRHIEAGNRLPNLLATKHHSEGNFHTILCANSFDESQIREVEHLRQVFADNSFDVVVGNPPWGSLGKQATKEAKAREKVMLDWCSSNDYVIGDKEQSQAFLLRSRHFLKENGKASLLVSAGVLFKHGTKSNVFRENWLKQIKLLEVLNFSHVRDHFFKDAISPFLAVVFQNTSQNDFPVTYWSAKQVAGLKENQCILLSQYDRNLVACEDIFDTKIWKALWFGRQQDVRLLKKLSRYKKMEAFVDRPSSGQGYKAAGKEHTAESLRKFPALNLSSFSRYGDLKFTQPPSHVHRYGVQAVYSGPRILVRQGIRQSGKQKGLLDARYEREPFCFTNSVNGIKLSLDEEWRYLATLGILWSSFGRYYFFMTSATWGLWHYQIHFEDELLQLPLVLDEQNSHTRRVISAVKKLREYNPTERDLLNVSGIPREEIAKRRALMELDLDNAVFDLYELNESERDLIRDCTQIALPFLYQPYNCSALEKAESGRGSLWLEDYAQIFGQYWNAYLKPGQEIRADVHIGANDNLLAFEFYISIKSKPWMLKPKYENWGDVLDRLEKTIACPMGTSQIILDGVVHAITNDTMIVIKRNTRRFWTKSIAREDAEVMLFKALQREGKAVS